jgi:hypothetical protein
VQVRRRGVDDPHHTNVGENRRTHLQVGAVGKAETRCILVHHRDGELSARDLENRVEGVTPFSGRFRSHGCIERHEPAEIGNRP